MSEWTRPAQPVRCVVELDKPLAVHRERGVLAQGDANANAIVAEVYSTAGKPYDLSGCTVQLIFVRPDNNALPAIDAEIGGNTATATLPGGAYAMSGMYSLRMQLRKNGAERTIVWIIGEVKGTDVDGIADPEHVISIGDIMASAKDAQSAASAASTAAQRANAGAERAEQLQIDASGLAGDSNKLGGKPPECYLPVMNLLDNPDFAIAQAGYGGSHGNTIYAADRWILHSGAVTPPSGENGIKITGGPWSADIRQYINNVSKLVGKTVTFAVKMRGISKGFIGIYMEDENGGGVGNAATTEAVGADWVVVCKTLDVTECTRIYVRMANVTDATATYEIAWAALYEGTYTADTLPPYVPRSYAVELAECQYYAQVIDLDVWTNFCDGTSLGAGYLDFTLPIAPMRKGSPDVILPTSGLYIDGAVSKPLAVNDNTISIVRNTGNYLSIQIADSQITAGAHTIATRGAKATVLIDMNL